MKILNDTLKDDKGKYSRKSLTALASFVIGVFYGAFLSPILELFFNVCWQPLDYVFYTLMLMGGGTIILTLLEKLERFKK